MKFFIPMKKLPTSTDQEKGINTKTKQVYLKPEAKEARAMLRAYLSKHAPDKPFMKVPLFVKVVWCFPITGKHYDGEPKITKPDTQNMNKALYDVMTELGFWDDDARICEEHICKIYSRTPGLYIRIEIIDEVEGKR